MVKLLPGKLNGFSKPSVVDLFQLTPVSQLRLVKKLCIVSDTEFALMLEAVKIVLRIY